MANFKMEATTLKELVVIRMERFKLLLPYFLIDAKDLPCQCAYNVKGKFNFVNEDYSQSPLKL